MAAVVLALGLAAGCAGSATVDRTEGGDATDAGEPTVDSAATTSPTDDASGGDGEPTADPTVEGSDGDTEPTDVPTEGPAEEPTEVPVERVPAEFRGDNIVAISATGRYAFAGTTSPWNTETPCDAAPSESLAVVDIEQAAQGEVAPFAAGLEQAADVRQLIVNDRGDAVVLSSCGPYDQATVWMQRAVITNQGTLADVSEPLRFDERSRDAYVAKWIDDDTIEMRIVIEDDPNEPASWIVERRTVAVDTGEVLSAEQFDYVGDDGFLASPATLQVGDLQYRSAEDPAGALGCEGFGVSRTLEVDDGSGYRPALAQPALVFSTVDDLHTDDVGHIAWTSGCEGFVTAYVGVVMPDGTIADAHRIDTYQLEENTDSFTDYYDYRLTPDGRLAGIGQTFDSETGENTPAFLLYDLATDPNFVNTAEPPVAIDPEPLFEAIEPGGAWYVGDTLALDAACGGRALYGRNEGGYVRAYSAGIELDAIVDVDLTETTSVEYDDGGGFTSRTVVVQTECPAEYEGRRVWFTTETEQVLWGLYFVQADLGEVADVLSVRDVVDPDTGFHDSTIAEVELLDGSRLEIELAPVPFDG